MLFFSISLGIITIIVANIGITAAKADISLSVNAITGKNKVNANKEKIEICKKLIREIKGKGKKIEFIHVFAHTNGKDFISINNEIVDFAARKEATKMK